MSELLPCPFSGHDASEDNAIQEAGVYLAEFKSVIGKRAYHVKCVCGVTGAADLDPIKAMSFWNTRLSPFPPQEHRKANDA